MTTEYQKTQLTLPDEVRVAFEGLETDERNRYIFALRTAQWTLQSISAVTGITRERVRQITESLLDTEMSDFSETGLPLPLPPMKPVRGRRPRAEADPAKVARLLELQPQAQQNRNNSEKNRQAAEDYTALLWEVHDTDKVSLYGLAKKLGVTHGALRFRLARYGYKLPDSGVSKVYTRIDPANRVAPQ